MILFSSRSQFCAYRFGRGLAWSGYTEREARDTLSNTAFGRDLRTQEWPYSPVYQRGSERDSDRAWRNPLVQKDPQDIQERSELRNEY
jgi:hypothetical protein